MELIKKFFSALWNIFKSNVKNNKDAIHEQVKKDVMSAVVQARS